MKTEGAFVCSGGTFRWVCGISWMPWRTAKEAPWAQGKWWLWLRGCLSGPRWATWSTGMWEAPEAVSRVPGGARGLLACVPRLCDQCWSMLEPAGQGSGHEVSKVTLPVEVYRNISKSQAKFLDMVSYFLPEICLFTCKLTPGTSVSAPTSVWGRKKTLDWNRSLL